MVKYMPVSLPRMRKNFQRKIRTGFQVILKFFPLRTRPNSITNNHKQNHSQVSEIDFFCFAVMY
jgi:hypothetical protein